MLEIKDGGSHACRSHFRKHICGLCGKKPLPVGNNNRERSSDGNDRRMVIIGRSRGKGSRWGATGRDGANCDSPEKTLPGTWATLCMMIMKMVMLLFMMTVVVIYIYHDEVYLCLLVSNNDLFLGLHQDKV